jgi:membrane-associated phospholipid phosphatase
MNSIHILSSWKALVLVAVITILTILLKKQNRWLELIFFISSMIGTFLFSKGINWLFTFMLNNKVSSDFPDEQSMLLLAAYGFLLFMLIRHNRNYLLSVGMFLLFLVIISAYFVSGIYLQYSPNNVIAGYVFSAAWVTGMLCALEMFRFLSLIKEKIKSENKS